MTEYWRSKSRHYCAVCNCWLEDNARSIQAHESGKQHHDAMKLKRKKQQQQKDSEDSEASKLQKQIQQLEEAARLKYNEQDATSAAAIIPATVKPSKRLRDDVSASAPGHPWQTALDKTTGMLYYYHPVTQQTTWNISETFEAAVAIPNIQPEVSDLNPSLVPTSASTHEPEPSNQPLENEEELDEMGLAKFRPVEPEESLTVSSSPASISTSHAAQTEKPTTSKPAIPIDTAALAALPSGLFKKRKKTS